MGRPVIVSARGSDIHSYLRLKTIRPLLRFVLRHADAVIAVCEALKDAMIEFGVPESKIHVIGNGIDPSLFSPEDRLLVRRQLGLPRDKPLILSVARIAEIKGIHHLIAALLFVRQQCPGAELLLVGTVTEPAYNRRLKEQIIRAGLESAVRFLGPQPHSTLRQWYNACDLFCLCSSREGWPNVLLEAMACGKPVVASRTGGVPEVVSSSDFGFLVDPNDHAGLGASIVEALQKKWDRQRIIQYASQHSWERVSARQQDVLDLVLSNY
jgi:glycosyltransferase involved in cell wall biosynthesis